MGKSTGPYPSLSVDTAGSGVVSQGGAVILLRTAEKTGLAAALSAALAPWRKPLAMHDPGKVLLDLAVSVALGGDCLADIAILREQPATVSATPTKPNTNSPQASPSASANTAPSNTERKTIMPKLLSIEDLSGVLGIPVNTLYQWRTKGTGPHGIRIGKYVRYRPADVDAWINQQAVA